MRSELLTRLPVSAHQMPSEKGSDGYNRECGSIGWQAVITEHNDHQGGCDHFSDHHHRGTRSERVNTTTGVLKVCRDLPALSLTRSAGRVDGGLALAEVLHQAHGTKFVF